ERLQLAADLAEVSHRLDDVAAARLALAADHRGALADAAERFTEPARAAHEGDAEGVLVDVVLVVGGCQDPARVDEVDAERFQHASLQQMADAALRHHRDGHRRAYLLDALDRGHARDAALAPDVGGYALEGHHRRRAGIFRDAGLLGRRDVED